MENRIREDYVRSQPFLSVFASLKSLHAAALILASLANIMYDQSQ